MRTQSLFIALTAASSAMAVPMNARLFHSHAQHPDSDAKLDARDNVVYATVVEDGDDTTDVEYVTENSYVTVYQDEGAPPSAATTDSAVPTTGETSSSVGTTTEATTTQGSTPTTSTQAAQATTNVNQAVVNNGDDDDDDDSDSFSTVTARPTSTSSSSDDDSEDDGSSSQAATTSSSTSTSAAASSTGSSSGGFSTPETITYSPYNNDSSCKDKDTISSDLSMIKDHGIKTVRIYGTDCSSITIIEPIAKNLGMTIDQGFWIGPQGVDSIDSGVQDLINWVKNSNGGDWSLFSTITVGNEAIYGGYCDGATLLSKIKSVKSTLRDAGYQGTVTTAEPPQSYINYSQLCTDTDGIDYVGVNAHPYFDANTAPADAGDFILSQISTVQKACSNRDVQITETGYPSEGNTNGLAVPTKENQAIAIKSIMSALNNKGVMFTVFDDMWKSPGPYNVEQHFGIIGLF